MTCMNTQGISAKWKNTRMNQILKLNRVMREMKYDADGLNTRKELRKF